ncbi:hypothetical protein BGX28_005168 [Mortierella sp. GBA30]|nr:hypothetical protein BGX28_005168 [Mortierella sp. GBA30]
MSVQFGPKRLTLCIDKNITKIGLDNIKSIEVYSNGDPKVLQIEFKEKLIESSALAEFTDPSPQSGKARKITLLCHCKESMIINYCEKLKKKGINMIPLSSDAAAKITCPSVVTSKPAKRAMSPTTPAPSHRHMPQEHMRSQSHNVGTVSSKYAARTHGGTDQARNQSYQARTISPTEPTKRAINPTTPASSHRIMPQEHTEAIKRAAANPTMPAPSQRSMPPDHILFQFPFKNSAKSKPIEVRVGDMERLKDGELLNDTLIEFGLKYVRSNIEARNPKLADKTHIFNSFFYQKLISKPGKGMASSYDAVKSWTNKTDLFSKKFIIIPIHEKDHWYLAIIANPGLLLTDADKYDSKFGKSPVAESKTTKSASMSPSSSIPSSLRGSKTESLPNSALDNEKENALGTSGVTVEKDVERVGTPPLRTNSRSTSSEVPVDAQEKPYILILDSLGGVHPSVIKNLRSYMQQELLTRKNITKTLDPENIPGKHVKAPTQKNSYDCGLFLLHYTEVLLKNPAPHLCAVMNNKEVANKYWAVGDLMLKREQYRGIVSSLSEQYKRHAKGQADRALH